MSLRVNDKGPWCGAYRRTDRRDSHVLLNLGNGRVAFIRDTDLMKDPARLVDQVQKRANLKSFNIRDILSDNVPKHIVEFWAANKWQIGFIPNDRILENALAVASEPYTFQPEEIFK